MHASVLFCLAYQRRVHAVCHKYSFWTFCFYFLDGIKNWIESVLSWAHITLSDMVETIVYILPREITYMYLVVGKLADIPFCDVNFYSIFRFKNLCPWFFWLALWTIAWLGELSRQCCEKLLESLAIFSHYFCATLPTNTSTLSFFGWTSSTSCGLP